MVRIKTPDWIRKTEVRLIIDGKSFHIGYTDNPEEYIKRVKGDFNG